MNFSVFPEVKFTGLRLLSKKIKLTDDECVSAVISREALRKNALSLNNELSFPLWRCVFDIDCPLFPGCVLRVFSDT